MEGNNIQHPVGSEQNPLPPVGTYNIAMCKSLMEPLNEIMTDVFMMGDYLPDDIYKKMMEDMKKLTEVPFYAVIREQSKKKSVNRSKREKVDNRKMIAKFPDLYEECKRCGQVLRITSMKNHLKSDNCKDIYYCKKATLQNRKMKDNNETIVDLYDKKEPLPTYTAEEIATFPNGWWEMYNQ